MHPENLSELDNHGDLIHVTFVTFLGSIDDMYIESLLYPIPSSETEKVLKRQLKIQS